MSAIHWPSWCFLLTLSVLKTTQAADDDYNILQRDGSFQFGYNNPNSYHHAAGNRNNVVRGEFGGRNPGTGRIDSTEYTAGPRGYRPRGKNVHRKYDLNQNGPRPVGSRDDPYYDPYEDPSYSFEFKTRTYNRQENANRVGDVTGRYNYIDDVGELHNVEFIAGKNTGFHVKTPFPDSNPRAYYGRLYYRGRGKPIPRGRTSIQRGLDGSYRFVSAGPDQRRTETSDSSGHVRGSYTYLDDKGVQHSVHYIAGPETGYRVLKNVKGPHLPTVYPFGRPEIIPPDFYDYIKDDVFDTAASGHVKPKPINTGGGGGGGGSRPGESGSDFGSDLGTPGEGPDGDNLPAAGGGGGGDGTDFNKPSSGGGSNRPSSGGSFDRPSSGGGANRPSAGGSFDRPPSGGGFDGPSSGGGFDGPSSGGDFDGSSSGGGIRPPSGGRPSPGGDFNRPGGDDFGGDGGDESDDFEGALFGPSGSSKPRPPKPSRPPQSSGIGGGGSGGSSGSGGGGIQRPSGRPTPGPTQRPGSGGQRPGSGGQRPGGSDDGSYKPDSGDTGDDGSYIPPGDANQDDGSYRPGPDDSGLSTGGGERPRPGGFGGSTFGKPTRPSGGGSSGSRPGESSYTDDYEDANGLFGSESNSRPPLNGRPPVIQIQGGVGGQGCERCSGTIVTNVGDRLFSVPPGVSVRAHVQSIDLLPLISKVPSPSEQYNEDMSIKTEQLNSAASDLVSNSTVTETSRITTTAATTIPTTTFTNTETTTLNE
ncbi:uncharacterized protein LOC135122680 isoform X2 [Zophobas morio]|uniref:uncharacterized protein LOC135122680 isoform X2 n=1 Tax=Zophobas morio TaxID=2755281 RepID=UPI003082EFC6